MTQRGTNTLLKHFVGLLDCARAARDGAEFEHWLATKGFISNEAITRADIWPFLRVLYVLSLDLHTSPRQTEAQIKSLLAHTVTEADASGVTDAPPGTPCSSLQAPPCLSCRSADGAATPPWGSRHG